MHLFNLPWKNIKYIFFSYNINNYMSKGGVDISDKESNQKQLIGANSMINKGLNIIFLFVCSRIFLF
jgi:hypothetical protein